MLPTDFIGAPVDTLPTPCLTLDLPKLEANLRRMQAFAEANGKALRPHVKSHKCTQLARKQVELGAEGICAAKISEAEKLIEAGLTNLMITGPVVGEQGYRRLVSLVAHDPSLIITLDNLEVAQAISQRISLAGLVVNCLLDLNVGQQRTGVEPDQAAEFAGMLASLPGLRLVGMQAYAGHLQHIVSYEERARLCRTAIALAEGVFHQLHAHGLDIFTVGGTGSCEFDVEFPAVTEIQPGSYPLMDADYLAIEERGERYALALTIQTTVLSANQPGFVTIDAGLKTIYRDGPAPFVVRTAPGGVAGEGFAYDWFGDEYGRITLPGGVQLKPGDRVEMCVSHCDPTVNLFDYFYVTENGLVREVWPIDLRGCSQ